MKKKIFLLTIILIISCTKREDNTQGNIINKWHLISIIENGTAITNYTCNTNFDITEFSANGVSKTDYSDKNPQGVCTQYTDIGSYTIANNILEDIQKNTSNTIIYRAKYKILELTSTTLKLSLLYLYESNTNGSNSHTSNFLEGQEVKVYSKIN